MALAESATEALYLKGFMSELFNRNGAIEIFSDSQSAKKLAENSGYQRRTKHIDVRYHFLREKIKVSDIFITYLPTDQMLADVLTKGLSEKSHLRCVLGLGVK